MMTLAEMPAQIQQTIQARGLLDSQELSDEQPAAVQQALPRVSALVMTSLAELASQFEGREQVWHLAQEAATSEPGISQPGAGLVKQVLVDRFHGTVHTLATATGLRAASVGKLFDVATGAALGLLGGLVAERNWSAPQLAQWLRPHQAEPVLTPVLGGAAPAAAMDAAEPSWFASRSNWLLMAVSIVAVAELGYIIGTRSAEHDATIATATNSQPAASTGRQYTAIPVASLSPQRTVSATTVPVPVVLKLKNGVRQVIGASSTESKLYQFLVDPSKGVDPTDPTKDWIGFDRIYFDSNKATLTNESLWQLSNVASILKRFPNSKIKIGGYTDNTGQPLANLGLSKARAQASLDALVSLGVPTDRLTAVGYGELDNIASNDTEEGRSVNRRVSMQVVQK